MPHITIRDYDTSDKDALMNLVRLNIPQYFAAAEEQDFSEYLDRHRERYFVLEADGNIEACGGLNFHDDKALAVISWDMVHPEQHGKGLGSALLKHRIDYVKAQKQYTQLRVRTSQHTFKFYEKSGFVLEEVVKDYWAPGFDLYRMEMSL